MLCAMVNGHLHFHYSACIRRKRLHNAAATSLAGEPQASWPILQHDVAKASAIPSPIMSEQVGLQEQAADNMQEAQRQLDELYTLLRAGEHNAGSTKQRAVAIIANLAADDLYAFMQQCIHTGLQSPARCSSSHALVVDCNSPCSPPIAFEEAPDSPQRAISASKGNSSSSKRVGSTSDSPSDSEDVQQLPDSPGKRARPSSAATDAEQQRQGPRGRFLAESLDLNLGSSYDLLTNASIADFSTAAAAARLSTTNLVCQSRLRVLSPVAEASCVSAAAALETQPEDDLSLDGSEAGGDTPSALPASPTGHQQQQQQQDQVLQAQDHPRHTPSADSSSHCPEEEEAAQLPAAQADACPSACSSPCEPAASSAAEGAAARRRLSVAESAQDWPSSQPLPFTAYDAEAGATSPVLYSPARMSPSAAAAAAAEGPWTPAAPASGAGAFMPVRSVMSAPQPQRATSRIPGSGAAAGAFAGCGDTAGNPRSGGVNPIGQLVMAPLHGANVLRRSLTKLWGSKPAGKAHDPMATPPATARGAGAAGASAAGAGSPSSGMLSRPPSRPLAYSPGPLAAACSRNSPSKGAPGLRQASTSPALQQPSFSVTQHGGSPTKAAAAAVAAASRRPSASPGIGGSSKARTGGNISYTPGAGRSAAAGGASSSSSSRLQAAPGCAAGNGAGAGGVASRAQGVFSREGSATPTRLQLSALHQQQQQQQQQQWAGISRPSSQASARTDVTVTGTGSHTSGGVALARFTGADSIRTGLKTPQLTSKQPRHKAAVQQGLAGAATGAAHTAGGSSSSSRIPGRTGGLLQQQQHQHPHSGCALLPQLPFAHVAAAGVSSGSKGLSGGGRSRIGAGRSGLRRSRSCGNMAEMLAATDVSGMRQVWQLMEQQQSVAQHRQQPGGRAAAQPAAAAAAARAAKLGLRHLPGTTGGGGAATAAAAGAMAVVPPHSRIGGGIGQQQHGVAAAARPSCQQQSSKQQGLSPGRHAGGEAVAAAGEVLEDTDACLPVLSRCHSPPGSSAHMSARASGLGPGASVVLARMGDVIGHVDALLAADVSSSQ